MTGTDLVNVLHLCRTSFAAFGCDSNGRCIGQYDTVGPAYAVANRDVGFVEFVCGRTPVDYGRLCEYDESTALGDVGYALLFACFTGVRRVSNWMDMADDSAEYDVSGNVVAFGGTRSDEFAVFCLD